MHSLGFMHVCVCVGGGGGGGGGGGYASLFYAKLAWHFVILKFQLLVSKV